jgi:polyhydroxyalkanoate synthesis regulator phasin
MVELIKKTVLAGIGLAYLTKEKAEEAAKNIAKEAKIKEGEGKKFIEEMIKKSEEARKSVEKLIDSAVHATVTKLDIPTRTEMKKLEERIKELEGKK